MANKTELLSILCGAFAVCGTIASLLTDCWQINSKGSVILSIRCRGLWRECVWDSFVKMWTCDQFSSYLNHHPALVVATRSLLTVSSVMSFVAFLSLLLGFRRFHYCKEMSTRGQIQQVTAGISFLVGCSSSAGIVCYCVHVFRMHTFEVSLKIPGFPGFEYGYSLWIAVGATLAAFTAAAISSCEICYKKSESKNSFQRCNGHYFKDVLTTYV